MKMTLLEKEIFSAKQAASQAFFASSSHILSYNTLLGTDVERRNRRGAAVVVVVVMGISNDTRWCENQANETNSAQVKDGKEKRLATAMILMMMPTMIQRK